jgi:hypothetical protein
MDTGMKAAGVYIVLLTLFIASCDLNVENPQPDPKENPEYANWLIPKNRVIIRNSAGDLIPPINEPAFMLTSEVNFLRDDDQILGVYIDGSIRAYPIPILNYHEVVNDIFQQHDMMISYSPLSGTAAAWDRGNLKSFRSFFRTSIYIYNSSHILFDEETASHWLPIQFKCVNGSMEGFAPDFYQVIKTSWENWKTMFPGTKVLSVPTGNTYNYGHDPYAQYRMNDSIRFTTEPVDGRLALKEEVHGIQVDNRLKVYPQVLFSDTTSLFQDNFQGLSVVIIGNRTKSFIVSYERRISTGIELEFSVYNQGPTNMIMKDNEGNTYDLFGVAVDGPARGRKLKHTRSINGYWFAMASTFPDPVIYQ